jgi:hypothetical protein
MDHRIALPKASQPSIRGDFFLLSVAAVFFAPDVLARKSMTGGAVLKGPRDHRADRFPLAYPLGCPLARPLGVQQWAGRKKKFCIRYFT